jgi:exonuclease III
VKIYASASGAGEANVNNGLSFAIQNCNSLNISSSIENWELKVTAIKKIGTDVIFLSDLRLKNKQIDITNKLRKELNNGIGRGYDLWENSSKHNRGCAILLAKDKKFEVLDGNEDDNQNIIALKVRFDGSIFLLVSVYGPNNTCDDFFKNLDLFLHVNREEGINIVMGGDWNTVLDNNSPDSNIDLLNMSGIPNPPNSCKLNSIIRARGLVDPYRMLHPTRRDFTYSPFGTIRRNKSRLDFFLISEGMISKIQECKIHQGRLCKLFDHHMVQLCLGESGAGKQGKNINNQKLKNFCLNKPCFEASVSLEFFTCALKLAVQENPGRNYELGPKMMRINAIGSELSNLKKLQVGEALGKCIPEQIFEKIGYIKNQLSELGDFSELWGSLNEVNATNNFTYLVEKVRSRAVIWQKHLIRVQNLALATLKKRLTGLKSNYNENAELIKHLEAELDLKMDSKLREQMLELKIGEVLNREKPSKKFLDLANICKKSVGLEVIRMPNGNKFKSQKDREQHIFEFYKDLYSRTDTAGSIEEFLGPQIANHPQVLNSKLNDAEKANLDKDLTLFELDRSLEGANLNSSPGQDGFNYKFIKKFWGLFRIPLFNCAKWGLNNKSLPVTFKEAIIKLIPKKDDPASIKNWRPISLLSNFYKLISRAINNRLKKIAPKILSRAQKGFCPGRYMHEVIINTLERIDYCKSNDIEAIIVSADLSKAFDSVSHEFMTKVYSFFNFGSRIQEWLAEIGTNRTAKIILEDGNYSESFVLGKGHAQEDSPSPLLFNFAQQIMLFKLELDPDIKK